MDQEQAARHQHGKANVADLYEALTAGEPAGVIWTLKQGGDLNVNLVRFPVGGVSASMPTKK